MGRVVEAVRIGRGKQGLVVGERRRNRRCGKGEDDDFFEGVNVCELLVERQQHVVDHEETVFGVSGNPADLLG